MSLRGYSKSCLLVLAGFTLITFTGCGGEKKAPPAPQQEAAAPAADQAAMPEGHPAIGQPGQPMGQPGELPPTDHSNIKSQKRLNIAPAVQAKWKEATIEVTDASTKKTETFTVKTGSTVELKGSGFKVKLEAVVPDYAIIGDAVESRSNDDRNPAVLVELIEKDKSVARGWVFRNFPDFNSYKDSRIQVVLVAPVAGK